MACYFPLVAYQGEPSGPRKTRPIFFKEVPNSSPIKLPCGQCIGCRLARARDWTIRMTHEASLHEFNSFLTLTYSDENLPSDESLNVRHLQLFFKRLRKCLKSVRIRFFACGEYGDKTRRPHYHVNVFGWAPEDLVLIPGQARKKHPLYRSDTVEKCWQLGNCWVGKFSSDTASYVAGYVVKKLNGDFAKAYEGRKPEFAVMSRRPGIGYEWWLRYYREVYSGDFVILKSHKLRPPKFYDNLFDKVDPVRLAEIREARIPLDPRVRAEFGGARLDVRHRVVKSRLSHFHREEL